jgi:hypothetical protein
MLEALQRNCYQRNIFHTIDRLIEYVSAANVCIRVRQLIDVSVDQHANANIPSDFDILIAIFLDRIDWFHDI